MGVFNNRKIDVELCGLIVTGNLSGDFKSWDFSSDDPLFVGLCHAGMMHSSQSFGQGADSRLQRELQQAIKKKLFTLTLIEEHH